jgi:hypothetical protein
MLTGLEQYSLERAGYFIRRNAVPLVVLTAGAPDDMLNCVLPTVREALSGSLRCYRGSAAAPTWSRGYGVSWDQPTGEQFAALARTAEHLQVRIDTAADESLVLLPGTHAAPPSPEDAAAMVAGSDPPGMVRVRLSPGDALFWNTNVIHRNPTDKELAICVTCVAQNVPAPEWAWEPAKTKPKETA